MRLLSSRWFRLSLGFGFAASSLCLAQEETDAAKLASSASLKNRADARTMMLTIPAPRGLITDRNGEPLAQSRVEYQLGLNFPQLQDESDTAILAWARPRLDTAKELYSGTRELSDRALIDHYRDRRWIPLAISNEFSPSAADKLRSLVGNGLSLEPLYIRFYPEKSVAAHIIGHVRSMGKLPTGPINYGDPVFEPTEGKAGLEKIFDGQLRGEDGQRKMLFDSDGSKLLDELVKQPVAGDTLVTTLDLTWQRRAEKTLAKYCERGAFVVIDIQTGEVLAMASRPTFDLNVYVPRISEEDYAKLRDDPASPEFARAFQGAYPPASTFKPVVALEALNNGVVTPSTLINCPAKVKIGASWFRNWSKKPEGKINVKRALARSTNPWFYKVGIDTNADEFLALARRLGFGKQTGLPLVSETAGLVPTDEWMTKNHGRHITHGDTAQLAIGQGVMLASPLQVAQAMAGIGNGVALPRLHLIRQLQNINGRVVMASRPDAAEELKLSPKAVDAVHDGMRDVVSAKYGTGKRASLTYTSMAGKTGTAEWGPASKQQRLAWFAGFFPVDKPRYAYAALYEGKPFETLSGGKKAAPMVRYFFEGVKSDVQRALRPPKKAVAISEEDLAELEGEDVILEDLPDVDENAEEIEELETDNELELVPLIGGPLDDEDAVIEAVSVDQETLEDEAEEESAATVDGGEDAEEEEVDQQPKIIKAVAVDEDDL